MSTKRLSDTTPRAKAVDAGGPRIDGRWAVISGGTVTRITNLDGTIDEARTLADGSVLKVLSPGWVRVFEISGGGAKDTARNGDGGRVVRGLFYFAAGEYPVVVGAGAVFGGSTYGKATSIGTLSTGIAGDYAAGAGSTGAGGTTGTPTAGLVDDITGTAVTYGIVGGTTPGSSPSTDNSSGIAGTAIVRTRVSA